MVMAVNETFIQIPNKFRSVPIVHKQKPGRKKTVKADTALKKNID